MTRDETDNNIKQIEKVLPEKHTNMLVIVDDLPHVWDRYANRSINVLPYHFWKETGKRGDKNRGQGKPAEPEKDGKDEKEGAKEANGSEAANDMEEIVSWVNESDCFLMFLGSVMTAIHQVFYQFESCSTVQVA